jgi:hypothetical protein
VWVCSSVGRTPGVMSLEVHGSTPCRPTTFREGSSDGRRLVRLGQSGQALRSVRAVVRLHPFPPRASSSVGRAPCGFGRPEVGGSTPPSPTTSWGGSADERLRPWPAHRASARKTVGSNPTRPTTYTREAQKVEQPGSASAHAREVGGSTPPPRTISVSNRETRAGLSRAVYLPPGRHRVGRVRPSLVH